MATIHEFTSSLRTGNFARKYNYDISFTMPRNYSFTNEAKPGRDMFMRCETFGFPGQNISTTIDDIRTGPSREHAIGVTYAPITATFLSSKDMEEKRIFTAWHSLMVDIGLYGTQPGFQAGYYNDYVTDILVNQYDDEGNNTYSVKLIDAFPKTIVQQDLALADGEFHRLSVEFVFWRWEAEDEKEKKATPKGKSSVADAGNIGIKQAFAEVGKMVQDGSVTDSYAHTDVAGHVQGGMSTARHAPPPITTGGRS